jgi:alkylation response protein AidB-like acyl-CoA dehydrogenase
MLSRGALALLQRGLLRQPFLSTAARYSAQAVPHEAEQSDKEQELEEFRQTVRDFAKREIAPLAAKIDHDNDAPVSIWRSLGDMGLLGEEPYAQLGLLSVWISDRQLLGFADYCNEQSGCSAAYCMQVSQHLR